MTEFKSFCEASVTFPRNGRNGAKVYLHAPYAFVPIDPIVLASPVGEPDHSRPMEGAVSGKIGVTWTVETPLLVGGSGKDAANRPFALHGKYAIPGATLRGLVRSLVEIAAFGRMSFTEDGIFRIRDSQSPTWSDGAAPRGNMRPVPGTDQKKWAPLPELGGWLFNTEDKGWCLVKAQAVETVPCARIAGLLGLTESVWHGMRTHARIIALQKANLHGLVGGDKFGLNASWQVQLVVTDKRPDDGNHATQKEKERLLVWPDDPVPHNLDQTHVQKFIDALNRDPNEQKDPPEANLDALITSGGLDLFGKVRSSYVAQVATPSTYGLPVLARNSNDLGTDPTLSITPFLSKTYKNSIHDLLARAQTDPGNPGEDALDFIEALFGWAPTDEARNDPHKRKARERAWRSRVRFGFATSIQQVHSSHETVVPEFVLVSPRPSFYPYYLRPEEGATHPLDYDNDKVTLSGRKRYPARNGTKPPTPATERMGNNLAFLKKGITFTSEIRLHNVLPEELGAIVWAITLGQHGGQDHELRHMIGRAKSYGHGQVEAHIDTAPDKTAVTDVVSGKAIDLMAAMVAFKTWVVAELNRRGREPKVTDFDAIDQIAALRGMASIKTGAELFEALVFPQKDPKKESDAEEILQGYMTIRKASYARAKASDDQASDDFRRLPPYPRYSGGG